MNGESVHFPDGFVWGAATASYQIEGASAVDGKGESIWDRFCKTPGKVHAGDTGDVACDHYHRYREDVALMKRLGLSAYRFSISWPRILPRGTGEICQSGLDFYERLVDELLAAGIRPFVTLYHWDLPQTLQDRGGWPNRDIARWFGDYVDVVARRLNDRVKDWITINEPWVVAFLGYFEGIHAPGIADIGQAVSASHNLLLAHGEAVKALRSLNQPDLRVGITLNLTPVHALSESTSDREAQMRYDGLQNRWFLDPVLKGEYPRDMLAFYGGLAPSVRPDDMARISQPIDFIGVNYYSRTVVEADPSDPVIGLRQARPAGRPYTEMDWEVYPDGLRELLVRVDREYGSPEVYITENGAAFADRVGHDGTVDDPERVDYLRAHFVAMRDAIGEGASVKGYFVWSLMDNFEWAHGYSKRFGVVYVDFGSQRRIPKSSARFYGEVIASNGVSTSSR